MEWVGGWVGGWLVDREVEEDEAVGMRCCGRRMGGWEAHLLQEIDPVLEFLLIQPNHLLLLQHLQSQRRLLFSSGGRTLAFPPLLLLLLLLLLLFLFLFLFFVQRRVGVQVVCCVERWVGGWVGG